MVTPPKRGGGCAKGIPLVTITDTDQQKMLSFYKYGT